MNNGNYGRNGRNSRSGNSRNTSNGYSRSKAASSSGSRSAGGNSRPSDHYPNRGTQRQRSVASSSSAKRSGSGYSQRSSGRASGGYSGGNRPGVRNTRQTGNTLKTGSIPSRDSYYSQYIEDEKLPVSVFIGIGVTVVAVIALVISIAVNSGKSKKNDSDYTDTLTYGSDVSSAAIVEIPDDEEDTGENPSSALTVQSFVGTWNKIDVPESQRATFLVTMQYEDSFEFRLEIWNDNNKAVISDTAFYTDETHAEYTPKKNKTITFERGTDYVLITHKGSNSSFGIKDSFTIDGKFTETDRNDTSDTTTTTASTTTTTTAARSSYDYNIYQSESVVKALSETLSTDDYALYNDMMKNGLKSPIDYERTTDKNGQLVNVDSELKAVKYYAYLSSTGSEMIFICSDNGNIYVLFYNSEEIIYYTNDKNYSSKMPESFQAVAKAKDIKPIFK